MAFLESFLLVLHVLVAIAICGLVLLQHGKGADMGAAFGSGASGSLFGATGSANFLSRATAVCATLFFACTLGLAFMTNVPREQATTQGTSVLDQAAPGAAAASGAAQIPGVAPAASVPATPASGAAQIPTN